MDYETIIKVLVEKIKQQECTIWANEYDKKQLHNKINELESKINTYNAQIEM